MTSIAQFNFPAFDEAAKTLRAQGHDVVSPAELDAGPLREMAMASPDGAEDTAHHAHQSWGDLLARDVKLISDEGIEAVVVLSGWERSRGARLETFVARLNDLPVLRYPTLEPVPDGEINGAHGVPRAPTGEVRVVDPETGGAKGSKLAQFGALDPLALTALAEVAGFGAQKYDRFNFLKGFDWGLAYDAGQRHLHAFWSGEDLDPESGLPHMAHAAWQCLCLLAFQIRGIGTDTRPPRPS